MMCGHVRVSAALVSSMLSSCMLVHISGGRVGGRASGAGWVGERPGGRLLTRLQPGTRIDRATQVLHEWRFE